MKKVLYFCALFSLLTLSAAHANQAEVERLRSTIDAALDVLYADSSSDLSKEDKQVKVRAVLEKHYDLDVIIRRAIGRNWRKFDPQQQDQVLELIKKLIVKAYVNWMENKERPEIKLEGVIEITEKRIEIPSKVRLPEQTVSLIYRLGKMRSGWQIYDVVAEDISVVSNYRQQIDDHFRDGNAEALIERLQKLLAKDEIDENLKI